MIVYALAARSSSLRGRKGTWYLDNVAVLMSLSRGPSDSPDCEGLSNQIHTSLFGLEAWFFWGVIPSKRDRSDLISRLVLCTWFRANQFSLFHTDFPVSLWELSLRTVAKCSDFCECFGGVLRWVHRLIGLSARSERGGID